MEKRAWNKGARENEMRRKWIIIATSVLLGLNVSDRIVASTDLELNVNIKDNRKSRDHKNIEVVNGRLAATLGY